MCRKQNNFTNRLFDGKKKMEAPEVSLDLLLILVLNMQPPSNFLLDWTKYKYISDTYTLAPGKSWRGVVVVA